jgi:dolichyl-phosphate-mannose-protein mannosyltransferase
MHFAARVVGLILIPIAVYLFSFYLHFAILNHSGPGDAQMSSLFQSQLVGNEFHKNPLEVAFFSRVTIKNNGYAGGLLHSHVQTFPHGSKQQQVTCYHHKDANNDWAIRYPHRDDGQLDGLPDPRADEEPRFLKHGDIVRLVHEQTKRNLHSHPVAAPITKADNEVSAYGNETFGDLNDHWIVEIVDDVALGKKVSTIRSLTTRFRLRHMQSKCLLRSHDVHLPEWGFKQAEVTCDKRQREDDNSLWNIEQHWNEKRMFLHMRIIYYTYAHLQ